MDKRKVDPRKPPLQDLQGHTYQHEIGDPDVQDKIEDLLNKVKTGKRLPGADKMTKRPARRERHS